MRFNDDILFDFHSANLLHIIPAWQEKSDPLWQSSFEVISGQVQNAQDTPQAAPEYISIVNNGDSSNRVDMWFIGDGYQASERQSFIDDVTAQFNDMITNLALNEPFGRYQNFFNVHGVFQASTDSGADKPLDNIFVDTAFDASYSWNGSVERCLYFDTSKAETALQSVRPLTADVEMRFGAVNDTKYGGCGGAYGVYAAKNASSGEVAVHEIGHSYAGLADEYWSSGSGMYTGSEPSQANVTTDSAGAKWSHWLGFDDGVLGPVGAYEGGRYYEQGIYRPTNNSKMRSLNQPFNAISKEKFILDFYDDVDPLDDWSYKGNETGLVNITDLSVTSIDNSLFKFQWFVDGIELAGETAATLSVMDLGLAVGVYDIQSRAYDDTSMVRIDLNKLEQYVTWQVEITGNLIEGTTNGETLTGTAGVDIINGLAGNDLLVGLAGADTINGGEGADTLRGGADGDILDGGTGTDTADFTGASARVIANLFSGTGTHGEAAGDSYTNIERLRGSSFDDTLTGDDAVNRLEGRAGDDTLIGRSGNDVLVGGAGADFLNGGGAIDWAYYDRSSAAVAVNLTTGNASGGDATGDSFSGIERLLGSDYNDTLTGNAAGNYLRGGMGDDILSGAAAGDILSGGGGADSLDGGAGLDWAYYVFSSAGVAVNLGTNNASGGEATGDSFTSIERVRGSDFADMITGNSANNWLRGGAGDDVLQGGQGRDLLQGEAGADQYVFTSGENFARIRGFEDNSDQLDLSSFGFASQADAISHMIQNGAHTVFNFSGDQVIIENILVADLQNDILI
ncbi:MAG: M64 family metallopeptidase [bacterium]